MSEITAEKPKNKIHSKKVKVIEKKVNLKVAEYFANYLQREFEINKNQKIDFKRSFQKDIRKQQNYRSNNQISAALKQPRK